MKVIAPAQIVLISTMADGSIKIVMNTPELPPEEMAVLFELRKQSGYWGFSVSEIQDKDLPTNKVQVGGKSPSQRLRANLYRYWESQGAKDDFESFYATQMERFITLVREKLD